MATVLQAPGVIFLVVLALVIVGYILIHVFFLRVKRRLQEALGSLASSPPVRITLIPEERHDWANGRAVEAYTSALPSLGFEDAGLWSAQEVPGLRMAAYTHPGEHVTAVVYEHPAGMVVLDMVTRYVDGTSVTCTTTDEGSQLEAMPGHTSIRLPGADTDTIFRALLRDRPDGEMVPAVPSGFKQHFERAYAEEMDWRLSRGGPSEEEVRRVALASGADYSDDVILGTVDLQRSLALADLDEALYEHFSEETAMPVSEWEQVSGTLFFVHDQLDTVMLQDLISDWTWDGADHNIDFVIDFAEDVSPREAFRAGIQQLPPGQRPQQVGTVSKPVEADVYKPGTDWFESLEQSRSEQQSDS